MLLKYLEDGQISWAWELVEHTAGGHTLRFQVQRDGMKLEGVRLSMSATLAQQIADQIGAVLPTPRLNDLVYQYAPVKLAPITQSAWVTAGTMATVPNMAKQSGFIDAAIGERQGLVADVGKDWTINNGLLKPTNGCGPGWPKLAVGQVASNYGWHVSSGGDIAVTPGMHVIQGGTWGGRCHDRTHADYCLAPGTRVLTADLRWVPIETVTVGMELVGFDEKIGLGTGRGFPKLRGAVVQGLTFLEAECYEIVTDKATVVASGAHRWPVRGAGRLLKKGVTKSGHECWASVVSRRSGLGMARYRAS